MEKPEASHPDGYIPTPAEIKSACEQIQSEWDEPERYRRDLTR